MEYFKRHAVTILGVTLFVLGGVFSVWYLQGYWQQQNSLPPTVSQPASIVQTVSSNAAAVSGEPEHLSIPSVNISLNVIPGHQNTTTGDWTSSITSAVYASMTPRPNNQTGNTFIYGHNRQSVFARLLNAQLGDMATIKTANGHVFVYKLVEVHDTNPTDLSVFRYQGPPILTLQTCSGLFYQNRRMFTFQLEQAS